MKSLASIAVVALSFLASCQSTPDTIRARRFEAVDEDGCGRIILDAGKYGPSISVTAKNGEPVWSATYHEEVVDEHGAPTPVFAVEGEVGDGNGHSYSLSVCKPGVFLAFESFDEGGLSIAYRDGAVELGIDAPDADKTVPGEPRSAYVTLTIEKGRLVMRDVDGNELTSFVLPHPKQQNDPAKPAPRATVIRQFGAK